jgi:hypothetical protein
LRKAERHCGKQKAIDESWKAVNKTWKVVEENWITSKETWIMSKENWNFRLGKSQFSQDIL